MDLMDNRPLCAFARVCDGQGRICNPAHETDEPDRREIVAHQGTYCPSGRLVVEDKESGAVLEPELAPSIVLLEDPQEDASGPIWGRGGVRVVAADGPPYEQRNRVTLCRCGPSSNKPFCDRTHDTSGSGRIRQVPTPPAPEMLMRPRARRLQKNRIPVARRDPGSKQLIVRDSPEPADRL